MHERSAIVALILAVAILSTASCEIFDDDDDDGTITPGAGTYTGTVSGTEDGTLVVTVDGSVAPSTFGMLDGGGGGNAHGVLVIDEDDPIPPRGQLSRS